METKTPPRVRRGCWNNICTLASGFVAALGLLVIIGWHLGLTTVVQIHSSLTPMQYNTALGFLTIGIAAALFSRGETRWSVWLSYACGLLGALTLFQYATGVSLGIDQLFMEHYVAVEIAHPGRMAANTALCFILTAVAIISAASNQKTTTVTAVSSCVCFSLSLSAIIGYVGGISAAYGWGDLSSMAIHTSLGFALLSMSLFAWSWRNERADIPQWLSSTSAVVGISTTVLIWQAIVFDVSFAISTTMLASGISATVLVVLIEAIFSLKAATESSKREILERQKVEMKLKSHTAELTRANGDLEQFAYVASHDLKSPLRAIDHLSRWIMEDVGDDLPEKSRLHLTQLQGRVSRMESLLDDLLSYARAGRTIDDIEAIDFNLLVPEIIQTIDVPKEFCVQIAENMPSLRGRKSALRQVLMNLICNAIKHHDRQDGCVTVQATKVGSNIEFIVKDDGPGIAAELHERAFTPFHTLRSRVKVKGSGLGLSIVRRLVENEGGSIELTSQVGAGSSFRVAWPIEAVLIGNEIVVDELLAGGQAASMMQTETQSA
ncbi:MAG: ATP-binding protein [bacterium]|nr:ATP-binding protein [bacterium]